MAAQESHSADEFEESMLTARDKGTIFRCGFTLGWVQEVFVGLKSQWPL